MQRLAWCLTTALFTLILCFGMAPIAHAASTCALSPIKLEVGIGASGSSTGLTDYISQVYQFIVGSIGVVAAVMIMFNGMRWVTAGGNSENITVAKGGISGAVIGLIIALMSYVLLYAINSSLVNLVDVCPEGLDFTGSITTGWTACPGGSDSECASVSYCAVDGGCDCQNIGTSGDGAVNVCRPTGSGVVADGGYCQSDDNCISPMTCVDDNATNPGLCRASDSGTVCTTDADCDPGLSCTDTGTYGSLECLQDTGRSNGDYCDDAAQCESGVCNTMAGVDHCVAGDATTTDPCEDNDACAEGYACSDSTYRCVAMASGSDCDGSDSDCGTGLYCVDNDGSLGYSTCQSGANGNYCDDNNECDSGFCAYYICTSGTVGSVCDNSSDCAAGSHCGASGGGNECVAD